ncbi:transposase [Enterobacter mori]|uniref:transposase n=1 Tax=Enterobacter mori TaxID=539813 RepID=UPI003B840ED6
MQKNMTPGRRKGCPNYSPEFKHQLVAASCEPGISISKLVLENGINANLLFKWRQQWREGKLLLSGQHQMPANASDIQRR